MKLILRYLWRSLTEKKARTFLVLFSIAASAALIFANEGFKTTVAHMFYEADTRHAGNSDLMIRVKKDVGAGEWINTDLLKQYRKNFIYANSFQQQYALYAPDIENMYYYTIYGVNMEEFQQHNPFALKEGSFKDWNGYKVIMGEAYAGKYGFSVGDSIALEMNGKSYDFTVAGIARQEGIYLRELADGGILFAPRDTLEHIFGGTANLVYIKLQNQSQLKNIYDELTNTFADYDVQYALDKDVIQAETSNYVLPFQISSIAVIFMSIFIIFTGFGLINNERIASLGTLRSIGLTRKKLRKLLIAESALVGAVGGIAGCGLGIGVLGVIKNTYFKNNGTFTTDIPIVFGWKAIVTAVLAAVLITVASAIFTISKTTGMQIKEIILHRQEQRITKNSRLWLLGIILLGACIVIPGQLGTNLTGMIAGCSLATGAVVGLILLIPTIVNLTAKAFGRLGASHEIYLGIRNVKDSKILANNLRLFAAMIAIVAYMVSIFHTMSYDLHYAWDNYNLLDVSYILRSSDQESLKRVKAVEGVSEAIAYYANYDSAFADSNTFINTLYGIEDSSFFGMNAVKWLDKVKKAVASLDEGNYVITTTILQSKLGLKPGDVITIQCGDRKGKFKITGFVDTNLGVGHIAYISGNNYRKLSGTKYYDNFMVRGNVDQNALKLNIKREFSKDVLSISTKQEMERANADKVDSIFKSINIYTYFAIAIGMLGIMNNIIAGYLERKRSLALYRCIGMSKKGISSMMLAEAVTLGVIGSTLGLITAFIMMRTIPQAVGMMWGNVTPKPAMDQVTVLYLAGLAAMLLISALPMRKTSKISIMESMKYE
jgi:putative ABC transport system permease protein